GGEASVGSIDVALVRESLEDDGGAGKRDEEAQEHRHAPVEPQGHGDEAGEHDREADLRSASGDHLPSHFPQAAEGELDADGKEQQDDSDFREAFHLVYIGDQAERVGAEQYARDDEPWEGRELDTVEHQDDEQGDGEDDRQVLEDVVLAHGGSWYVIASGPVGVGGDAGHTARVKTIMENRVAGCKLEARISCSITAHHPWASLDVSTSQFRLLRQDDAVRDAELSRTEAQLRLRPRQFCVANGVVL